MPFASYNPFSLEGKTILVTGASSGIGAATAVECSKMGASIIAMGRNEQRLEETFNNLDVSFSQTHLLKVCDLADESQTKAFVESIPTIDGLVNNVGVNRVKQLSFIKAEDMEFVFNNNLFSTIRLTSLLLKKKKINKQGSIVFTSSVSAFYNAPGRALYASSKAALTSFMRSVAVEYASRGIRSNAIHPGMVETKMAKEILTEEVMKKDMASYPLRRYGKPKEVAWSIVYLLSDATLWMTGTSITIDGGFMLK